MHQKIYYFSHSYNTNLTHYIRHICVFNIHFESIIKLVLQVVIIIVAKGSSSELKPARVGLFCCGDVFVFANTWLMLHHLCYDILSTLRAPS